MTRIDSTRVKWQVQIRKSRAHKWMAKGTFETRATARAKCLDFRDGFFDSPGYEHGQTRVVRHISGKGKA